MKNNFQIWPASKKVWPPLTLIRGFYYLHQIYSQPNPLFCVANLDLLFAVSQFTLKYFGGNVTLQWIARETCILKRSSFLPKYKKKKRRQPESPSRPIVFRDTSEGRGRKVERRKGEYPLCVQSISQEWNSLYVRLKKCQGCHLTFL